MAYFKIDAKCGHVGKSNYIVKSFYIECNSKKEAASIVRQLPRVKHHHKDAIINVAKINEDDFNKGRLENSNDPYFQATSSSEQRLTCTISLDEIIKESENTKKKKKKAYQKRAILEKDLIKVMSNEIKNIKE